MNTPRYRIQRALDERARIWHDASDLVERAARQNRNLTSDEQQRFDRMSADMDALTEQIRDLEATEARDLEVETARAPWARVLTTEGRAYSTDDRALRDVFTGKAGTLEVPPITDHEMRDLLKVTNTAGGYAVPTSFRRSLWQHLIATSSIFRLGATIISTTTGENIQIPTTTAYGTAAIVGEGTAIAESDPALGQTTIGSWKYAQLLQISSELAVDNAVDLTSFVARQAAYALSNGYGSAFISGNGTTAPQGIMTSAATAVTTQTGATGVPSMNNLIDLVHSVASPYRQSGSAAFLMNDSSMAAIRKITDTTNRPLWEPSVKVGDPDSLMGYPIVTDPNVSAFGTAASTRTIAFGSWENGYVVRDAGMRIDVSADYAFANDLISYRITHRLDGKLVDSNAIKIAVAPTS